MINNDEKYQLFYNKEMVLIYGYISLIMNMKKLLFIVIFILLTGCTTTGKNNKTAKVKQYYGEVKKVEAKEHGSNILKMAGLGAIVGAFNSGHTDKNEIIFSAILGAISYGVSTALVENINVSFEYVIESTSEGMLTVKQDDYISGVGTCVSVRLTKPAIIKQVNSRNCFETYL